MIDICNGTEIYINRGNSVVFTITLSGEDIPTPDTDIYFVVRKTPEHPQILIQKNLKLEDGTLTISIDPEDTENIILGNYSWNLIIMFDSGAAPWTVSKDAFSFIILPEIGRDCK